VIVPSSFGASLLSIGVSIFISIVVAASLVLPRKCGKRTRDGHTCGNWCIPGTTVCHLHGGRSPQVERAGKEYLAALAYPVLGHLHELEVTVYQQWQSETCPTCGYPKGDPMPVIRAITAVLDRAGFGPSAKLDVRATAEVDTSRTPDEAVEWIPDTELQRIVAQYRAALREARERMTRGEPRPVSTLRLVEPPADAIDAVVVVEPANGEVPVAAQPNDAQPAIDAGTSDRQDGQ
jgi:hypothetical protein